MQHPIISYCERHNITLNHFAVGVVDCNASTIYRLVRLPAGRGRRPSAELMDKIERRTNGEITRLDLFEAHFGPIEPMMRPHGATRNGEQDHSPVPECA